MAEKVGGCSAKSEGFACTRKRGHAGRHIARGIGGVVLKTFAPKRHAKVVTK
jgi:hypothetical protein